MLTNGDSVSHYQIFGELGRGGMGVVYKAEDTKLNRTVALKVLPPHALASADDRSRFYREARAAAALHHPHIATVFEIDEVEGKPFIAMEFVDGEPLDERIARGPLPLQDAVAIARQIAKGLKVAHAKDIVHRDIKAANIMLTHDGKVKILDFGLAQTAASTKLTQMGSTVGTVAYMSPEQARGGDVDNRSDLWSIGAVLYEMITGKLPFKGEFEQAVIYSILNEQPEPLTAVRTGVPMGLEWIVTKLLAKDRDERYQSATDLLVDLKTVDLSKQTLSRIQSDAIETAPSPPNRKTSLLSVLTGALGLVIGLIIMGMLWAFWPQPEAAIKPTVKRFEVLIPEAGSLSGLDISPDGSKVVYTSTALKSDNLRVLDLTTGQTSFIAGSAGALIVAVSPDGEWVLVTNQLSIQRVSLYGGSPLLIAETGEGVPRAQWGPPGWVIYEEHSSIWKSNLDSRESMPLTMVDTLAGEIDHDWPHLLPDGRTVVATIEYSNAPSVIGFWDFETGERKGQVLFDGYRVQYTDSGHLVFVLGVNSGSVVALPFDLNTLSATDSPIPVAAEVDTRVMSVSRDGTLVTAGPQDLTNAVGTLSQLSIVTFPESLQPLGFEPEFFGDFDLNDSGTMIVAEILDLSESGRLEYFAQLDYFAQEDVWVFDLNTGGRARVTFDGRGADPTWWPGTDSLVYINPGLVSTAGSVVRIGPADGSGSASTLFSVKARIMDVAISPDRKYAAYVIGGDNSARGLTRLVVRHLASGNTVDLNQGDAGSYRHPAFSPDGSYLAYERDNRVWVSKTDGTGVPIHIGQSGQPQWLKNRPTLFMTDGLLIHRRDIIFEPRFSAVPVASGGASGFGDFQSFAVFPDGRSALVNIPVQGGSSLARSDSSVVINVTVNWFETLK